MLLNLFYCMAATIVSVAIWLGGVVLIAFIERRFCGISED